MDNNDLLQYSDDLKPYRPLFDNSLDAIYLINSGGIIVECNKAAARLSGELSEKLVGAHIQESLFGGGLNVNYTELYNRLAQGESVEPIVHNFLERNSELWFELTPVYISDNLIAFRVRDLTSYLRIVEDLKNSEAYNKVLFTDSHIPLVVMDAETFEFTDCNDAAVKIYGFNSREEILFKTPKDFSAAFQYGGEPSEVLAVERIKSAIEKGSLMFDWRLQRPNGEVWDGEVHLMSFKYRNKLMLQFSLLDITDRKRAREAQFENEEKYRTLFESANDAIFLMNNRVFIDCNARSLQMFGGTRDQIVSHSPVELSPEFQPDGQPSSLKAKDKILLAYSGTPQFFDWKHKKLDETLFDAEVSLNRVLLKGEYYLQAIVRDVSDRKKAERIIKESEDRFNIISENSNDVIWIRDLNLRFKYISPSVFKILGYSVEEAMELNYSQITTPEYTEKTYKILAEELELEGKPYIDPTRTRIIEVQEIKKDGSRIWTETQATFIRNEDGVVTGILGVTRDITERKLVEDALRDSEERYRITIEKTGEVIFEYNITTGEIIWLGAVEAITGFTPAEFSEVGVDRWSSLIHQDDRQEAIDELEKAIVTNCDYFVNYRFKRKDGQYIFLEVRGIVMPGMKRMFGSMNDITERKKAQAKVQENEARLREQNEEYLTLNEELVESNSRIAVINDELRSAKEKAEENDRLKSAFLANMSHEIRTPMNGLIGFSEMIIQPDTSEESRKLYAEIINTSCNQLLSIINDVIDISKIETNQVIINENRVILNQLLNNIFLFFQPTAKNKNIQFKYQNTNQIADIEIITDEVKLNQIINNLVNNALKFTQQGVVEFGFKIRNGFIEFFVKDTGIGIDSRFFESIFDRFRQVDMGITRTYGGTGLGLSISKAFVNKLGGDIWLESKLDEGTTFYFTIPYKPAVSKDKKVLTMHEKQLSLFNINILVAEDEDVNFMYINLLLKSYGINVIRAENGQKAIDAFSNNPNIDIILMDIKMPVMDGVEATKRIKAMNSEVPIIATTAYALSGEKEEFLAAGCNDYISKPIKSEDLIAVIKKHLKH